MLKKIYDFIDYNRFLVITPIVALIFWFIAVGCTPTAISPINPTKEVNAAELETEFAVWQKEQEITMVRFNAARADIEKQQQAWNEFQQLLVKLSSGSVADLPGLVQLLAGGTLLGAVSDNLRKRGVIAGLKRNA
jgi:hypothetical protein